MFIPYRVDVSTDRRPIANYVILSAMVVGFFAVDVVRENPETQQQVLHPLVLDGWRPLGLLGHMFLHADFLHLLGNGVFLWVFGNAVCARIGDLRYALAFLVLGIVAAATHLVFDGAPAVGASGAINGIVGMFLVMYPTEYLSAFFWFGIAPRTIDLKAYWAILLWFVLDLLGALSGLGGVAYMAHIGGLVGGVATSC